MNLRTRSGGGRQVVAGRRDGGYKCLPEVASSDVAEGAGKNRKEADSVPDASSTDEQSDKHAKPDALANAAWLPTLSPPTALLCLTWQRAT